ncbi:trigger factor [Geomonas sp. Red276]
MQSNIESLSNIKKKINLTIPADRVNAEVDKAYAEIRKQAAIKGFRKGKVPMTLIEKHYGEKMAEEVVKTLINDTYYAAVAEHGLEPVSYPMIDSDPLKPGEPFSYSATVEVYPKVELKEYLGLQVAKEQLSGDNDEAVASRLKQLQENLAQLAPAAEGHPAANGDFVTFDFKGTIDGVPFEGGEAQDYQLELGSGRFIAGFEEQMVGMTVGSQGTVKVTFPESYGNSELAGKPAEFAVEIKEIKVKELPELNDDFAKEFGEFETLDELKAKLAEVHASQENQRVENDLRERVMKVLVAKNEVEVPEVLVERHLNVLLDQSKQRLAAQRLTLEMMGLTDEGYRAQFRGAARDQVKGSVILDAIADKEGIEVTDEDVKERVEQMAASSGQDVEKIASFYRNNEQAKNSLGAQLREDKAMLFVLDKANVVELPKDQIKD